MPQTTRTIAATVALSAGLALAQTEVAMLDISGALAEQPSPLAWLESSGSFDTLASLTEALRDVAEDEDYDAVMIRLRDAALSRTQIQEIGHALRGVQAAGKRVHLYAENFGNGELLLGSFADETILQAGGSVSLSGMYMEEMFLADTLAWLGIRPDMVQVGDYKGANEMYMQASPTEAWDWNINQLLDGLYADMRGTLRDNLGLTDEQLDSAMETGWFADAQSAIDAGLVDTELDLPMLTEHLETAYADEITWHDLSPDSSTGLDPSNPFAMLRMLTTPPDHSPRRESIAVLHVVGTIVDGNSSSGGFMGGESVGSRTIRRALEDILDEELIKGVVVRIDSPGGSAIASEVMWQGLRRVADEKPVWISVGSMAASGGYYTAVGGEKIYVNPGSIVGSIGVVGGKFSMGGLYDKLRVNVVSHTRGPRAELFSSVEPWDAEQRTFVRKKMTETYDLFTSRVTAGRPEIDLSQTAEGRLFTGTRAIELGMADRIGSLDVAVADLAAELGMTRYDTVDYPAPKSFDEVIQEMLGGFVRAPEGSALGLARAAEELLGPRAWRQVSNAGRALMGFRDEPVQVVVPRVLMFD